MCFLKITLELFFCPRIGKKHQQPSHRLSISLLILKYQIINHRNSKDNTWSLSMSFGPGNRWHQILLVKGKMLFTSFNTSIPWWVIPWLRRILQMKPVWSRFSPNHLHVLTLRWGSLQCTDGSYMSWLSFTKFSICISQSYF